MEFFFFPTDYQKFSMFIEWVFNKALDIVFLVWIMNYLFSTLQRITRCLSHNGGRML